MKRFGFSLDGDMHDALRARALEEGTSMAAICREALFFHLQRESASEFQPQTDTSPEERSRVTVVARGHSYKIRTRRVSPPRIPP